MKKIINRKMYNTETATLIGGWSNGYSYSDFSHCEEDLYKKRTGEFFLHGSGGAMSKYCRSCGQNEWCGGEEIIPLTLEEAMDWAEDHLGADDFEATFGEVEE